MTFKATQKKNKDSRKAKPWRARIHSWYSTPMWLQHKRVEKMRRAIIYGIERAHEQPAIKHSQPNPRERPIVFRSAIEITAPFARRHLEPLSEEIRKAA